LQILDSNLQVFGIIIASNCHKDKFAPAVLPEATQEGKNTIGFSVNGEVWRPYYKCTQAYLSIADWNKKFENQRPTIK